MSGVTSVYFHISSGELLNYLPDETCVPCEVVSSEPGVSFPKRSMSCQRFATRSRAHADAFGSRGFFGSDKQGRGGFRSFNMFLFNSLVNR